MKQDYVTQNLPVLNQFLSEIRDVDKTDLPKPHFPTSGREYENSEYKIAFFGWETRDNYDLEDFYYKAIENPRQAFFTWQYFLDNYCLLNETNNFGSSFWDYNLKLLSMFYGVNYYDLKSKSAYKENKALSKILSSFIWGNVDSIERLNAADRGLELSESFDKVKRASKIFDYSSNWMKFFKPNVLIVTHDGTSEEWFVKGFENISFPKQVSENLWYGINHDTQTHIFWTKHPRRLNFEGVNSEEILSEIILILINSNEFSNIPGKYQFDGINTLNKQLNGIAAKNNLTFSPLPLSWRKRDAGFYFESKEWKNFKIGFAFDKSWGRDFFGGICRKTDSVEINDKILSTIENRLLMKEKSTANWPYWFWMEEPFINWNKNTFDKIENGEFAKLIEEKLKLMKRSLDSIKSNNIDV